MNKSFSPTRNSPVVNLSFFPVFKSVIDSITLATLTCSQLRPDGINLVNVEFPQIELGKGEVMWGLRKQVKEGGQPELDYRKKKNFFFIN